MRVRGKGAIIRGGGLSSPPAPFIEISEDEGRALIGMGVAVEVFDEDAAPAPAPAPEPEPESAPEPAPAPAPEPEPAPAPANPGEGGTEPSAGGEVAPRDAQISEVFEILEADDLVKTGDRAGHPKVSAIEAATGLNDVTAAEVDALWAAREGAE